MAKESAAKSNGTWWSFWPAFVAGLLGPLFGNLLARWMPHYWSSGFAAGIAWFFVGLILMRRFPPKYGIPRLLAAILMGAVAGLSAVVLWYYFPLK
jgi:uncharacterized membrane protein YjjP (DUF1212 family)